MLDDFNVIKLWERSLIKKDLDKILNTYDPEAVLLGTFAKNIKQGRNQISIYFTKVFAYQNLNVKFMPHFWINEIENNSYVLSGIYIFSYTKNGRHQKIHARYTFVVKNGKILNHHSSVVPE